LLTRLAKDTGEESTLWQVSFGPAEGLGGFISYKATIAGEQVITNGNNAMPGQAGGAPGSSRGPVPMSIHSLNRKTGTQQWATEVDGGATGTSQPLVVAGRVYVTVDQSVYSLPSGNTVKSQKSYIVALNAEDGKLVWRTPPIEARQFAPVIAGPLLLTCTEKGDVVAYDAPTGKEKWRAPVSIDVKGAITPVEAQLFVDKEQLLVP